VIVWIINHLLLIICTIHTLPSILVAKYPPRWKKIMCLDMYWYLWSSTLLFNLVLHNGHETHMHLKIERQWPPRLLVIVKVQPNLVIIFSKMNFETNFEVQYFNVFASTHFLKYLVVVIIYISTNIIAMVWNGLEWTNKLISQLSNGISSNTDYRGISYFLYVFLILWHLSHELIKHFQCLCKVVYQSQACKIFLDIISTS
jgi:hypothetical protein